MLQLLCEASIQQSSLAESEHQSSGAPEGQESRTSGQESTASGAKHVVPDSSHVTQHPPQPDGSASSNTSGPKQEVGDDDVTGSKNRNQNSTSASSESSSSITAMTGEPDFSLDALLCGGRVFWSGGSACPVCKSESICCVCVWGEEFLAMLTVSEGCVWWVGECLPLWVCVCHGVWYLSLCVCVCVCARSVCVPVYVVFLLGGWGVIVCVMFVPVCDVCGGVCEGESVFASVSGVCVSVWSLYVFVPVCDVCVCVGA